MYDVSVTVAAVSRCHGNGAVVTQHCRKRKRLRGSFSLPQPRSPLARGRGTLFDVVAEGITFHSSTKNIHCAMSDSETDNSIPNKHLMPITSDGDRIIWDNNPATILI